MRHVIPISVVKPTSDFLKHDYEHAFDKLLNPFRSYLSLLPETRQGKNTTYSIYDFAVAAFSIFFMQQPSFLAHQRFLEDKEHRNNLCSLL